MEVPSALRRPLACLIVEPLCVYRLHTSSSVEICFSIRNIGSAAASNVDVASPYSSFDIHTTTNSRHPTTLRVRKVILLFFQREHLAAPKRHTSTISERYFGDLPRRRIPLVLDWTRELPQRQWSGSRHELSNLPRRPHARRGIVYEAG